STGLLKATEAGSGTGIITNTTIGTNAGKVMAGSISHLKVTNNTGVIMASGQGTTTDVTIDTNSGTLAAVEDSTAGSGVMSNTTITENDGTVSAGSISGMMVTDNAGAITAAGQGKATGVTITTNSGTLTVKADTTLGSGALSNSKIGTLTPSGKVI